MDFLEDPPFPVCPSFGFTSEPMYRVTPVVTSGGHETRNRHWARPLHRYTASVDPRGEEDIAAVLEFWHALGGESYGFRFKDGVDFKSCRKDQVISSIDQPLIVDVDNSPSLGYQLVKDYTAGVVTQRREILKPVDGTILIADNGVTKTEGVDYTIDYTTGIVTLGFSPAGTLTWGGEFDVPSRFVGNLAIQLLNKKIDGCQFVIMELRDPGEVFA